MLALILRAAGWHPSFLIGGDLNEVGTNAVFDAGEWLVVEADESDGTFLELGARRRDRHQRRARPPRPLRRLRRARRRVRAASSTRIPGACVAVRRRRRSPPRIAARRRDDVVTYGFADDADYRMRRLRGRSRRHAVRARRATASALGARRAPGARPPQRGERGRRRRDRARARRALRRGRRARSGGFGGVARRFQFRGERDGVTFVDDYAHLPERGRTP